MESLVEKNHEVLVMIRSISHKITNANKEKILHVFRNSLHFTTSRFSHNIKQKYMDLYDIIIDFCLTCENEPEIINSINEAYEIYEKSVEPRVILKSKKESKEKLKYLETNIKLLLKDLLNKINECTTNEIAANIIKMNIDRVDEIVSSKNIAKHMLYNIKINISPKDGFEVLESLVELECATMEIHKKY